MPTSFHHTEKKRYFNRGNRVTFAVKQSLCPKVSLLLATTNVVTKIIFQTFKAFGFEK